MQAWEKMHLLLGACVLTAVAVLGAVAAGSVASQQMAEKRQIALQFHEDMHACESLDADAADLCARHAHAWAEVARAELASRRERYEPAPADESRFAMHYRTVLARWLKERGASRREG